MHLCVCDCSTVKTDLICSLLLIPLQELGNSSGSHFSSSSPMTIDVQLGDIGQGLLGSSQLTTINQSELALGLGGENLVPRSETPEQPMSATPSPAGSLQDEDMDDFKVRISLWKSSSVFNVFRFHSNTGLPPLCHVSSLLHMSAQRSVLVDSPLSLSSSSVLSHVSSHPAPPPSFSPAAARRGGGKPATLASAMALVAGKKGRKKKDPNEPQKPVSAYALFFRDTQAAIKGQNPNASFGEVSKIVASMWDSLAEEQKQVHAHKLKYYSYSIHSFLWVSFILICWIEIHCSVLETLSANYNVAILIWCYLFCLGV